MARPYWLTQEDAGRETCMGRPAPRCRRRLLDDRPTAAAEQEDWAIRAEETVAVVISAHAAWRRAQRHLRIDQLLYVLTHGEQICRAGAVFHVLRHCDIDPSDRCRDDIAHLEGAVVLTKDDIVVTVYRSRQAYRRVRRKQKYERHRATPWEEPRLDRYAA
ncbi:MAG: hypothetical protein ACR2JY_02820 [Chloroflexota bacterium]